MNTDKPIRQIVAEWNARAKAEGRLLEQDPWALPPLYEGSVLDVPLTPEAEERIRHLDALLAGLEQEKPAAATDEPDDRHSRVEAITAPPTAPEANTSQATVVKP
jgi:hypothetical protein